MQMTEFEEDGDAIKMKVGCKSYAIKMNVGDSFFGNFRPGSAIREVWGRRVLRERKCSDCFETRTPGSVRPASKCSACFRFG